MTTDNDDARTPQVYRFIHRYVDPVLLIGTPIVAGVFAGAKLLWPNAADYPEWGITLMMLLWLILFFQWAASGGIPPRYTR